jgi:hypothetical protein
VKRWFLLSLFSLVLALAVLAGGYFFSVHYMQEAIHWQTSGVQLSVLQKIILDFNLYFRSEFWMVAIGAIVSSHVVVFSVFGRKKSRNKIEL